MIKDVAAIHMVATKGAEKDPVQERGQATWIVYAVLRHTANNVDLSKMVDHAGVIAEPPTIFDLASRQHITAEIRVDGGTITFKLAGRSALDS